MRMAKSGFLGFLAGFFLALMLYQWVWLEMRVNVGRLIPVCMLLFVLLGFRRNLSLGFSSLLLIEGALTVTLMVVYGFDVTAFLIVPAALIREGFSCQALSLDQMNVILIVTLLAGNALWVALQPPRSS